MIATIDREGCIACGLCPANCPAVFQIASDGFAEVIVDEIPKDEEDAAKEAEEDCPVSVIHIK